jgi:DNA modification methylase
VQSTAEQAERYMLYAGDCRAVLATFPDNSVDSVVTDPPYAINIKRTAWDKSGIAFDSIFWAECLRVLKPGGHALIFGHSTQFHRLVTAVEDGGFEFRDSLYWARQGAFPVSTNVAKVIDGVHGGQGKAFAIHSNAERYKDVYEPVSDEAKAWSGWGTALRGAVEPLALCRKALVKPPRAKTPARPGMKGGRKGERLVANIREFGTGGLNLDGCSDGVWPTNVLYCPKDTGDDRPNHPTVKPVALMRWLVRLITPPGGVVLDPFMGSGSTGVAALREGFGFVGIDLTPEYVEIARRRNSAAL